MTMHCGNESRIVSTTNSNMLDGTTWEEEVPQFVEASTFFRFSAMGILHQRQEEGPRLLPSLNKPPPHHDDTGTTETGTTETHHDGAALRLRWRELPSKLQGVLRLASFLGTEFHDQVLDIIIDDVDLDKALNLAHQSGWIRPIRRCLHDDGTSDPAPNGWWRFDDDRIPPPINNSNNNASKIISKSRNPLSSLFQEKLPHSEQKEKDQEAQQHLDIGRALWAPLLDQELSTCILSPELVAQQLIWGSQHIHGKEERYTVARLLLTIGQSTVERSSDFRAAYYWFEQGIQLLFDESKNYHDERHRCSRHWRDEYDLSLALYNAAAEAAYCCGEFTIVEELCEQVSAHHRDPVDGLRASTLLVYKRGTQNDLNGAIKQGLAIIKELKVGFPPRGGVLSVPFKLARIKRRMGQLTDEQILTMKPLDDRRILGALRIMVIILEYSLHAQPLLVPQMAFWMVEVVLTKGMSVMSSDGMAGLGLLCCNHFNEFDLGQRAARLSLEILEMHKDDDYTARCATPLYMFCFAYTKPLKSLLEPMADAAQVGLRRGDLECAMLCASLHLTASLVASVPMSVALSSADMALAQMKSFKQDRMIVFTQPSAQFIHNLMGYSADPVILTGKYMDCDAFVEECTRNGNLSAIGGFYQARIGLEVLLGEFEKAEITSSRLKHFDDLSSLPPFLVAGQYQDEALTALALCRNTKGGGLLQRRRRIRFAKRKLAGLLRLCRNSEEFLPNLYVVQGELCAVRGMTNEAMKKFGAAIQLSQQRDCYMVTGFAQSRLATTLAEDGRVEEAKSWIRQAMATYNSWGAVALVAKEEEQLRALEDRRWSSKEIICHD